MLRETRAPACFAGNTSAARDRAFESDRRCDSASSRSRRSDRAAPTLPARRFSSASVEGGSGRGAWGGSQNASSPNSLRLATKGIITSTAEPTDEAGQPGTGACSVAHPPPPAAAPLPPPRAPLRTLPTLPLRPRGGDGDGVASDARLHAYAAAPPSSGAQPSTAVALALTRACAAVPRGQASPSPPPAPPPPAAPPPAWPTSRAQPVVRSAARSALADDAPNAPPSAPASAARSASDPAAASTPAGERAASRRQAAAARGAGRRAWSWSIAARSTAASVGSRPSRRSRLDQEEAADAGATDGSGDRDAAEARREGHRARECADEVLENGG